ncbi:MAG: hypothetical protein K2V38_05900 [Gemmataceae bacterium]|nr:hypothetical protein [Gemmataceae bacterium]
MKVHRLIMLPNGRPLHQERIETDDLNPDYWSPFAALFNGPRCEGSVPTDHGNLRVLWNGSSAGSSLGTFWLNDAMFLAVVFAPGINPEADTQLLTLAGGQWAGTDLVKAFAQGQPSPFASLADIPDRPLLVGILAPSLEHEVYKDIAGIDLLVTAAFLAQFEDE